MYYGARFATGIETTYPAGWKSCEVSRMTDQNRLSQDCIRILPRQDLSNTIALQINAKNAMPNSNSTVCGLFTIDSVSNHNCVLNMSASPAFAFRINESDLCSAESLLQRGSVPMISAPDYLAEYDAACLCGTLLMLSRDFCLVLIQLLYQVPSKRFSRFGTFLRQCTEW